MLFILFAPVFCGSARSKTRRGQSSSKCHISHRPEAVHQRACFLPSSPGADTRTTGYQDHILFKLWLPKSATDYTHLQTPEVLGSLRLGDIFYPRVGWLHLLKNQQRLCVYVYVRVIWPPSVGDDSFLFNIFTARSSEQSGPNECSTEGHLPWLLAKQAKQLWLG